MKSIQLLALVGVALSFFGCGTTVYDANGRKRFHTTANVTDLYYDNKTGRLTAKRLDHATPAKAAWNGAAGFATAAGAAAVTGGLVP